MILPVERKSHLPTNFESMHHVLVSRLSYLKLATTYTDSRTEQVVFGLRCELRSSFPATIAIQWNSGEGTVEQFELTYNMTLHTAQHELLTSHPEENSNCDPVHDYFSQLTGVALRKYVQGFSVTRGDAQVKGNFLHGYDVWRWSLCFFSD